MQNSNHQITGIISIFTLLQFIVLIVFGYTPYPDSVGYIEIAHECLAYGDIYPSAKLINDYPFLWNIGAINAVIASLWVSGSVMPLLVIYTLLKGITAALFYLVVKHQTGQKTALIALIMYVLYPANYGEATSTLSELPFMFFMMSALWLCLCHQKYVVGGMFLAIANWFRPMGIVFLAAIIIWMLYTNRRKAWQPLCGYLLIILIIGSLCSLRTGLFLYQAKTGWMALTDYSTKHMPQSMAVRDNNLWNVSQKDSAWQSLFLEWVKDHKLEYAKQIPGKFVNTYVSDNVNMCTFIPDKTKKEYMYEEVSMGTLINSFPHFSPVQWLTAINLIFYYALIITALFSLKFFKTDSYLLSVTIILLGTLLLLFVGHGEARFHILFIPFFIMLSAMFINIRVCKG
jgi:4-amino-4-deoxy-L-arabinose transferase-like glycosyltransferase